jgi:hypothetical protein
MKRKTNYKLMFAALAAASIMSACNNKNEDVVLPPIGGYNNSNEVAAANLKAYWDFDGNQNEIKSGTASSSSARVSYTTGIKGQAIKLDSGFVFYNSIPALNGMTTFSVSSWVQTKNSQAPGFTSMIFQLTKPSSTFGNINLGMETGWRPVNNDTLVIHGWYTDPANGLQDNRNDPFGTPAVGVVKDTAANHWVFLTLTCDNSNPVNFLVYANGVSVGAYNQRGPNVYTPVTPSSVVIGGWINNVPGQPHTADTWPHAFVGSIDQVRVYNKALTPSEISSLYQLEKAGR